MNGVKVNRGLHIPDPLLLDLSLTSGDNDTQRAAVTIEVHAKHARLFTFLHITGQIATEFDNEMK